MKIVSAWLLKEAPISLFAKEKWALVFCFSIWYRPMDFPRSHVSCRVGGFMSETVLNEKIAALLETKSSCGETHPESLDKCLRQ